MLVGLEAHHISLATHPQLAQDQGAQGVLGWGQAQVLDLRSSQSGQEIQLDRGTPSQWSTSSR